MKKWHISTNDGILIYLPNHNSQFHVNLRPHNDPFYVSPTTERSHHELLKPGSWTTKGHQRVKMISSRSVEPFIEGRSCELHRDR